MPTELETLYDKLYREHEEVERLTAEVTRRDQQLKESVDHEVAYMAERDRLRADIERHVAICTELATENERLRAALERARQCWSIELIHEIAREALAGGHDYLLSSAGDAGPISLSKEEVK